MIRVTESKKSDIKQQTTKPCKHEITARIFQL